MKKLAIYSIITASLLAFSCKDLLEEDPKSLLISTNFYKTAADANSAVNAISGALHTATLYKFRYLVHTTALEDYASGQGFYIPLAQYQVSTSMISVTDQFWTGFYKTIDAANLALKYVPGISMDEKQRAQLLGEAHFYRAFAYYNLAKLFGAVPIRTEPTEGLEAMGGKREPIENVYALVISDLKAAETALPPTQSLSGKPTSGAAKIMLADVYLLRGQWAEARDKAQEVIVSQAYSLVNVKESADFEKLFGADVTSSTEEIFSIKFQRSVAGGSALPQFYHLNTSRWASNGYGTFFGFPTYPLLRDWPEADLRKNFNLYTAGPNKQGTIVPNGANQPIRFGKFKDSAAPTDQAHGSDFPIYRYADALLIYAEAASQAEQGPTAQALERLNMVRRRAYGYTPGAPSPIDFTMEGQTMTSFRELVLKERAYEFFVEGKRWWDLVRTGTAKQVIKAAKGIDIPNSIFLMPIPKQEIDNNPDIAPTDQNPGY
nr:RagB/SusD family nutrient uptake outer membrane protein [uncultured Dyadobacter sp.]